MNRYGDAKPRLTRPQLQGGTRPKVVLGADWIECTPIIIGVLVLSQSIILFKSLTLTCKLNAINS